MSGLALLPMILLLTSPAGDGWKQTNVDSGVTVFTRPRLNSEVTELRGTGLIDAPPDRVRKVILDYPSYPRTMPYMQEARVLGKEPDGKTLYVYNRVSAPLIAARDYVLKVKDESRWDEGRGFLKVSWTVNPDDRGVAPLPDVVRVRINDGYWHLEPREGGTKTFATYYLFTDPGGTVPKFVVNHANTTALPDIFKALRKAVR